jgi:hypothetical protein
MSKSYMPFQDTKVSAEQSMGAIMGLLKDTGFQRVAQVYDNGHERIIAVYEGAEFVFEANSKKISGWLWQRGRITGAEAERRAKNVAWRIVWNQVKNACDLIKWNVVEVAEIFGGQLAFGPDRKKLASFIVEKIHAGEIEGSRMIAGLLPGKDGGR